MCLLNQVVGQGEQAEIHLALRGGAPFFVEGRWIGAEPNRQRERFFLDHNLQRPQLARAAGLDFDRNHAVMLVGNNEIDFR